MSRIHAGSSLFVLMLAIILSAGAGAASQPPMTADRAAPRPLKDINPAPGVSSQAFSFVSIGAATYFTADDGTHGRELWRTDATADGTVMVRDINPAAANNVDYIFATADRLFFDADDGIHGRELWTSDGSEAGTVMVTDILTGSAGSLANTYNNLVALDDTVFFTADDGVHGMALWRSDGTAAGTVMVKALSSGDWGILDLTAMGDTVFFSARTGAETAHPSRLWRTDGTAAGTVQVTDLRDPEELVVIGDRLFFAAYTADNVRVVASTDGTSAGAAVEQGLPIGVDGFPHATLLNVTDLLYMFVSSSARFCSELRTPTWKADSCNLPGHYGPADFTEVGGDVFFGYRGDDRGAEIWRSADGTGEPELAYDINPGEAGSQPSRLMNVDNRLYFAADDGVHGSEIWRADPATGQVNMIADIVPGAGSLKPYLIHNAGSAVYFLGEDMEHGQELWVVPGTIPPDGSHLTYLPLIQSASPAR